MGVGVRWRFSSPAAPGMADENALLFRMHNRRRHRTVTRDHCPAASRPGNRWSWLAGGGGGVPAYSISGACLAVVLYGRMVWSVASRRRLDRLSGLPGTWCNSQPGKRALHKYALRPMGAPRSLAGAEKLKQSGEPSRAGFQALPPSFRSTSPSGSNISTRLASRSILRR